MFDFTLENIIPWGLCYLSSSIKKNGRDVSIYCTELDKELLSIGLRNFNLLYVENRHTCYETINNIQAPVWQEIKSRIAEIKPDIVGLTCVSSTYDSALNIARLTREINPASKIIFGGIHPTAYPLDVIKNDDVDFVVKGEGEQTFAELIDALEYGAGFEKIKGLLYKNGNNICETPERELIENIDSIPYPQIENLLNLEDFPKMGLGYIFTSRGCPYNCSYCASNTIWTRKVRLRSPENVISELKDRMDKFDIRDFCFFDDTFTIDKKRVGKICDMILDEGLNISWCCYTRLDALDEMLLKKMAQSGCKMVSVGIETCNDSTLKHTGKGIDSSEIIKQVKLVHNHGIKINGFVMLGFPGETQEDIKKLKKFVKKTGIYTPDMSITTPYPGTEFYNNMKMKNMIPEGLRWYAFYPHNPDINLTGLEQKEFEKIIIDFTKFQHRYRIKNKLNHILNNPLIILQWIRKYSMILISDRTKGFKRIIRLFSLSK